ncbi:hypothetical protein OAH12_02800 [Cyclobacteriaceae bacterium]|nr:hypothetical protein [Cyclobacteriaceae bacterium]
MLKRKYWYLTLLFFIACKSPDKVEVDEGKDYYPIAIGHVWVYDIQEVNQTILGTDTISYQVKEEITEIISSINNETTYKVIISTRQDPNDNWTTTTTSLLVDHRDYLVIKQNNTPIEKLHFPLADNSTWDGNRWNNLGEQTFEVININTADTVGDMAYSQTMKVEELNDVNLITSEIRYSNYARKTGLIYYYYEDLETQPGEATQGSTYTKTLVSFTK